MLKVFDFCGLGLSFYDTSRALSVIAVIIMGVAVLGYIVAWLLPGTTVGQISGIPYFSAPLFFIAGKVD